LLRDKVMKNATYYAMRGFLCSEAVLLAISEYLGITSELIPRIATGFGAGIGRRGEVCGALAGGAMGLGLKFGRSTPESRKNERRPYWFAKELTERFKSQFGHLRCMDLLGLNLSRLEDVEAYRKKNMWNTRCRWLISETAGLCYDLIKYFRARDELEETGTEA
jgi:C_GCAxxG_C_C family probable redox protein